MHPKKCHVWRLKNQISQVTYYLNMVQRNNLWRPFTYGVSDTLSQLNCLVNHPMSSFSPATFTFSVKVAQSYGSSSTCLTPTTFQVLLPVIGPTFINGDSSRFTGQPRAPTQREGFAGSSPGLESTHGAQSKTSIKDEINHSSIAYYPLVWQR